MNFAHPVWLILLMLPPLLGVAAVLAARLRGGQWAAFIAPRLRGTLLKRGTRLPHWLSLVFLLAATAAMIAAMARPQGNAGTRSEKSLGRNVLFALDLSRSMRVQDVKPDRLSRAKMTIYELMEGMPNERMGLIGFAGTAYVYAPLTIDHRAVRETVEQIDENWITRGGSNLGDALRLAIETLKETGQKNNALVILSDGEKHDDDLDDLIDQAVQAGVFIVAIGVGTEDGDYVPNPDFPQGRMVDRDGQPVISRLQSDVMRQLASETRGRYTVASGTAGMAEMVRDVVNDLDTFEIEGRERAIAVEFYQWLLLPAILFMIASTIAATRWRAVQTAAIAAAAFLTSTGGARADRVSDARDALKSGNHAAAREAYRDLAETTPFDARRARFRLGEATAALRAGDFRAARDAFSGALLSGNPEVRGNSHLGMGRSLFQLGWLVLDGTPYPESTEDIPTMEDFDEMVRAKLDAIRQSEDSTEEMRRMKSLVTNWTDALRHFESAGSLPAARHNRDVTMTYLKRLMELIEEDRQQTEDSLPQEPPQSGQGEQPEGEPQEGEGGEPREQDGSGEDQPRESEGGREGGEPREGGEQARESEQPRDGEGEGDEQGKQPVDPNESPEERARRILGENADLEKGPPVPGRHEFSPPEKDW
ncbi:MAG: vWA domain-containing protein [Luteolibacter sp.]